jgi:hypothetical protein
MKMKKYVCFCGFESNNKKECDNHADEFSHHLFLKSKLSTRIVGFLLEKFTSISKHIGLLIIYGVIIHHFDIKPSLIEACLMGMAIGLLIS